MTDPSDDKTVQMALLQRAASGDARAAQELSRLLGPRAFAQAFRMLGAGAEAEDVAQEAMLRLWRVAPNWADRDAKPSTWLYRVVANLCIDRMRRTHPVSLDAEDMAEPSDPAPGVEARMQAQARRTALHAALQRLPDRQRQATVLRHIEGLGNPEIAEIMEISVEAVESLTARGKRALAQDLAGQRDQLGFEYDEA